MRARSTSEITTTAEAFAVLGLDGPTDPASLRAAFRTAIKAARPDVAGGDGIRFRRVIAAWRLLRATDPALYTTGLENAPASLPVVTVTALQALQGARIKVTIDGRTLSVRVTRGVRTGEFLNLRREASDGGDLKLPVLIRGDDTLDVIGDDLHMTWPVPPRVVEDGGRIEIHTHAGPRSVWLTAGQANLRLRIRDLGLPARRKRPQGHLFVTLVRSVETPSPAEDRLAAFTRLWTPERLAA